jgi:predicted nucleic acid-binding protein
MGVVIDTGVFIRWEREGGIIEFSRWSSLGEPCISVITESELKVADIHARIVSELTSNGTTIGPHDNWIAATALMVDYELLTTNAGEFRRVPNLRVIPYPSGICS